ncbi:MAG: RDD family protein, partial [Bryobacteraceae bacterium]
CARVLSVSGGADVMQAAYAELAIETPEGVRFSLPLAGPASRFLAWLIDTAAIGLLCGLLGKVLQMTGVLSIDLMWALIAVSYFAVWVGYGIAFEWTWRGETPGKRVLGLRVLDERGLKLQFSQIALRNLMRFLDALPALYLVGGAAMILSQRYQRLGDLVANTVVIRRRSAMAPDVIQLDGGEKFNSFLDLPHLAARLRQQVSPELAQIAYETLLRRDQLSAEMRIEVFRQLAEQFRQLARFPEETTGVANRRAVCAQCARNGHQSNAPPRA